MPKEIREHVVRDVSDFPESSHKVVRVGRREIRIFNIAGKLHGLSNVCRTRQIPYAGRRRRLAP